MPRLAQQQAQRTGVGVRGVPQARVQCVDIGREQVAEGGRQVLDGVGTGAHGGGDAPRARRAALLVLTEPTAGDGRQQAGAHQ